MSAAINPLAILRRKQVEAETGLSRSEIYRRISRGTFPRQIHLGPKSVGWYRRDVQDFLSQPAAYRTSEAA
ncbi:AlpA family phage regulatory protein [Caballeronia sp. LZ032]|uniref:helix-turn-helix transcriptional regulator n=1 Tax=Caballeronia sp. LZ032 TaxID=3038565 RepID=UPI00285ECE82|nr:AlpA family phage regulatory protein [Caballeronia sp. LZ032]MDR5878808.1 AlpA family phage regulatory protein [Caballeronia sp. LZ032]